MDRAPRRDEPHASGDIVDFEEALLDACPIELQVELMTEAAMLAALFKPEERAARVAALAQELRTTTREAAMPRPRARKLAAALKRLAKRASCSRMGGSRPGGARGPSGAETA